MDILAQRPPSEEVSLEDVVALGAGPERLVRQVDVDSEFGQPALTVFANGRFLITVLFWLDGTTCIHEHGFSGAFHVLHGQSLHTTFSFEDQRIVNEHLKLGMLREKAPELLQRGATREIRTSGGSVHAEGVIHSLFHLAHPSATVVVRTYDASIARPTYTYWRPGIACNQDYDRKELKVRRAMMALVHRASPERFFDYVQRWLANADFTSGFLTLLNCSPLLSAEEYDELLESIRLSHPELASLGREVSENFRREKFIVQRRSVVTDPELRFFLAVLLNVRGLNNAKRVVSEQYPGMDSVDRMLGWTRALGAMPSTNEGEDSVLGFPVDDVLLRVLGGLLRGMPDGDILGDTERAIGRRLSERDEIDLRDLCAALKGSELFRYIFS